VLVRNPARADNAAPRTARIESGERTLPQSVGLVPGRPLLPVVASAHGPLLVLLLL
jgi:hypothetical protein